jgi:CheY-specific phosphatase CheX
MSEMRRTTSSVLVGLLLTVAGLVVASLAIVVALMVAAAIMGDHAPRTP